METQPQLLFTSLNIVCVSGGEGVVAKNESRCFSSDRIIIFSLF